MRQTKTFPLLRASQINSLHPTEIQLPGLVSAKNVYISPSDNAITLRHDFYTFREDIPTLVDHWTGSTAEDKSDFLNMLLTGPVYTDQQFITRMLPMGLDGTCLASTYIDGTITTTGASGVVTGSSTKWVKNVWPHCFIQFAGSSNIYEITDVTSDTSLTVDGTPSALSGVTYKIYRTHDYKRGAYPGHFDQLANNYVYNMATPFDNDSENIKSICGPFTMVKPIARVTEIQEIIRTGGENNFGDAAETISIIDVTFCGSFYLAVGTGYASSSESGSASIWTYYFFKSTDGNSWTNVGKHQSLGGAPLSKYSNPGRLRYFSGLGVYFLYGYSGTTDSTTVILFTSDGTNPSVINTIKANFREGDYYVGISNSPDIAYDATNLYINHGSAVYRMSPTTLSLTRVYLSAGIQIGSVTYYNTIQGIVWTGTYLVCHIGQSYFYSSDGTTWLAGKNTWLNMYGRMFIGKSNRVWIVGDSTAQVSDGTNSYSSVISRIVYSDDVTAGFTDLTTTPAYNINTVLWGCHYDSGDDLTVFVGRLVTKDLVNNTSTYSAKIYSLSGTTYTERSAVAGAYQLLSVSASSAGTGWVAAGTGRTFIQSTNGTSWSSTFIVDTSPDLWKLFIYLTGPFVVGQSGTSASYSDTDGKWNFGQILTANDLFGGCSTDTGAIVTGATGTIFSLDNQSKPTSRTSGVSVSLNGAAWNYTSGTSKVVVVVGNATGGAGIVLSSSDEVTWTSRTSNTTKSLNEVCHDGSALFVSVGEDGAIIISSDGTTWSASTSGTSEDLNSVCYSKQLDLFCAVGDAGTILTSSDGVTWTAKTSGISTDLYSVTWSGSAFCAVGQSGVMIESITGTTWTSLDTGCISDLYSVICISDYRLAVGDEGVCIKVYNSTLSSTWSPVSDTYRSSGFAVASGFLVLVGTSEYENGRWVYHPRRVRWAVPGTVDTWEGEGAGGTDLQGTGAILDCRTLGYNIILFESSQISALNSTDDIYSPFSYQVIHSNMRAISNPLVIDQLCYFITPDGKLYRTNGFNVQEVCQPFDLTKYKDFDDAGPIWLTYDREIRRILCYRPRVTDTVHECFIVDPDNATVTVQELPSVTVAGGGYYKGSSGINFARSIPSIPTDYKFISTLEVTDTDGDGDPDFPSKTPVQVRWIVSDEDDGEIFRGMTYNSTATLFVICGFGGKIYTITSANVSATTVNDDHDCTAQVSGTTEDLWGVAYDGTKYVAVGTNGTVIYSSNATSWSAGTAAVVNATDTIVGICDSTTAPRIVAWADDGSSMYILYSEDNGATFSLGQTGFGTIYSIEYVNSKFVMVGDLDSDWYSDDGITWTQILDTDLTLTSAQNTFYLSSQYHVCGSDGNWVHSTNLTDWATTTIDTAIDSTCGELANSAWMFTGTYKDPQYYIMFTDNGERFFYVRKPTPPTHTGIECWTMIWTGTYLCVLGTDRTV